MSLVPIFTGLNRQLATQQYSIQFERVINSGSPYYIGTTGEWYGYPQSDESEGPYGNYNANNKVNGKTIQLCGETTTTFYVRLSGFSADPGADFWYSMENISDSSGPVYTEDASYSYISANGVASWTWTADPPKNWADCGSTAGNTDTDTIEFAWYA